MILAGVIAIILAGIALLMANQLALIGSPVYMEFGSEIKAASMKWNVPEGIITAVIQRESSGDPGAVGRSGNEIGLMQLKPGQLIVDLFRRGMTPRSYPSFDPAENIHDGTAGLRLLRDLTGSWYDALRAYNCCGTNINRVKSNPALSSDYADDVLQRARENGYMGPI